MSVKDNETRMVNTIKWTSSFTLRLLRETLNSLMKTDTEKVALVIYNIPTKVHVSNTSARVGFQVLENVTAARKMMLV